MRFHPHRLRPSPLYRRCTSLLRQQRFHLRLVHLHLAPQFHPGLHRHLIFQVSVTETNEKRSELQLSIESLCL